MTLRMPRYTDDRYAAQRRAGFSWLRFADDLEEEYRNNHPLLDATRLRLAHSIALVLLFGFIALDWFSGLRILPFWSVVVLIAFTAPALAIPVVASYLMQPGVAMQRVVFWAALLLAVSITVAAELGRQAHSWFPYEALILVVMYVYLVSGLLYFQAATVGLSVWLLFAVFELVYGPVHRDRFIYESYFLFVANVVGLLGLYALQYEARKAFLIENELKQEAMLDSLTGLLNRREFRRHFDSAWLQARRDSTSIGLVMIDVDNFKQLNDNCGHLAGDEALKCIGAFLHAATMRPLDAVGRYGGDEFLAVWYAADPEWFRKLAEELPQRLSELVVPGVDPEKCRLQISGGAVLASPDGTLSPQDAIRLADRLLYERKREGGTVAYSVLSPDSLGS